MKIITSVFLAFFIYSSCTNVVDIDQNLKKPIVTINALFRADNTWQISVTRSRNILGNMYGNYFFPVDSAVVTIYDNNGLLVETLTYSYDSSFRYYYNGNTTPVLGKTYTVKVQIENEFTIRAMSNVPLPVQISSIELDSSRYKITGEDIDMSITFNDVAGEKNYYCVKILRDAFYLKDEDTVRFVEDVYYEPVDPAFQNDFTDGLTTLIRDNLFDGDSYQFRLHMAPSFNVGNTESLRVALLSVSEEYYQYFTTKNLQTNSSEDPFSQPTQVFSNIENGIGIFAGYSVSTIKL